MLKKYITTKGTDIDLMSILGQILVITLVIFLFTL
jgi:hypothetical protein